VCFIVQEFPSLKEHHGSRGNQSGARDGHGGRQARSSTGAGLAAGGGTGRGGSSSGGRGILAHDLETTRVNGLRENDLERVESVGIDFVGRDGPLGVALVLGAVDGGDGGDKEGVGGVGRVDQLDLSGLGVGGGVLGGGNTGSVPGEEDLVTSVVGDGGGLVQGVGEVGVVGQTGLGRDRGGGGNEGQESERDRLEHCVCDVG